MKKNITASRASLIRFGLGGAILLGAAVFAAGCGSTDGGSAGDDDFNGGGFVDSDGNVGRIELDIVEPNLDVAETSGFFVRVYDSAGQGVPSTRITCDTEGGVALIEPSNGFATTDSTGSISGRLGCTKAGSYLVGCRLPVGSSKREFQTVFCSGTAPDGWNGFPGAGGGGLGGDSADEGGDAQITDVLVYDAGNIGGGTRDYSIDTAQDDCDEEAEVDCEPFFDTILGINVSNSTGYPINFSRYRFRVFNANGSGDLYQSSELALSNADEVPARKPDGTASEFEFLALFARAAGASDGGQCPLLKTFLGTSSAIGSAGFKNVEVTLIGTNSLGEEVIIRRRVGMSFDNFDRCG